MDYFGFPLNDNQSYNTINLATCLPSNFNVGETSGQYKKRQYIDEKGPEYKRSRVDSMQFFQTPFVPPSYYDPRLYFTTESVKQKDVVIVSPPSEFSQNIPEPTLHSSMTQHAFTHPFLFRRTSIQPVKSEKQRKSKQALKVWSGKISLDTILINRKELIGTTYLCPSNTALLAQYQRAEKDAPQPEWPTSLSITALCPSSQLSHFKKMSVQVLAFSTEKATTNYDTYLTLVHHLTQSGMVAICELINHSLLLIPFKSQKLFAVVVEKLSLQHYQKFAIKTLFKSKEQLSSIFQQSAKYNRDGCLSFEDKIIDGFYDPGRSMDLLPIEDYDTLAVNPVTREVLLVDSTVDLKLAIMVQRARDLISSFTDPETQARVLSLYVSNCFGGDFPSTHYSSQEIAELKIKRNSNVIPLGEVTKGVCRHRSILYKYLCDRLDIWCELKRGNYSGNHQTGAHSWNVIKLGTHYYVVDIMHEPTQLYPLTSEKARNYLRLHNIHGEHKLLSEAETISQYPFEFSSNRYLRLPNFNEKAIFHERLGRGGYGSVYRASLGGLTCAVKKIDVTRLTEKQLSYSIQEVQLLETFNHINIVRYLGHELVNSELQIYMELFPLSLGQLIERRRKANVRFSPSEIKFIALEILAGICYLHENMVIHRDLKSDNVLIDMNESGKINKVKITDFGVCKVPIGPMSEDMTRVGTELYMPSEVHLGANYSTKTDMFSFGMVLVELLTLAPPFLGVPKELAVTYIKSGVLPALPESTDENEKEIVNSVKSCLHLEQDVRPSASQLTLLFKKLNC